MSVKTVTLAEDAYSALAAQKGQGESFSEVVRRLTGTHRSLMEFAGAWKDVPEVRMKIYRAWLKASDRASKQKLLDMARPVRE
ncbi:MAG: antitoxin VapB family protein [Thermoplasmata archaeon]|nr:antitoxin VapB family protein [Thermoplasmata archaeon]